MGIGGGGNTGSGGAGVLERFLFCSAFQLLTRLVEQFPLGSYSSVLC
jgi:hypothetical protein